ncbi:hypothetical protein D3C76_1432260 [compost metagenome]
MCGIALDGFHQVGNQVGTALILVLHLAPGSLGLFIEGRDVVDATGGEQCGQHQQRDHLQARPVGLSYIHQSDAPFTFHGKNNRRPSRPALRA